MYIINYIFIYRIKHIKILLNNYNQIEFNKIFTL